MTRAQWLWWALSATFGVAVIAALAYAGGVDTASVASRIASAHPVALAAIVVLVGANAFLSAEKWRLVERSLQPADRPPVPRREAFALTALGGAAGQVLPVAVATAAARAVGSTGPANGGRAVRNALCTAFEQCFDMAVVALLAAVSLACVGARSAEAWPIGAALVLAASFLLIQPCVAVGRAAARRAASLPLGGARLGRVADLAESGLLAPRLARGLLALSAARFGVVCAIAPAVTAASDIEVSALHLVAAMPLAVLAGVLALTPAGLGVGEVALGVALVAFGTPFGSAMEWALANRILVTAASLLVGAGGALMLLVPAGVHPCLPRPGGTGARPLE